MRYVRLSINPLTTGSFHNIDRIITLHALRSFCNQTENFDRNTRTNYIIPFFSRFQMPSPIKLLNQKNNEIPKVKMIETHSHFLKTIFWNSLLSLCSLHICISETIWNNLSWLNEDKTRLYTYPTYHKSYNTFE